MVEAAIIIVVIGLVFAGVFMGKELVEESKRQAVINDINKFRSSFNNFKLKYNAFPGDIKNATSYWASAGTGNGDGDEVISYASDNFEAGRVFEHLKLSKVFLLDLSYISYTSPGNNIPKASFSGAAFQVSSYQNVFQKNYSKNAIIFGGVSGTVYAPNVGAISPQDAFSIDSKLDDGAAGKGNLVSFSNSPATDCISFSGGGNDTDENGDAVSYNLTSNHALTPCLMLFYMDE